jgi:hypothetical protein
MQLKIKLGPNEKIAAFVVVIGWVIILFTAVTVQQNYRLSANDPQVQLADDAAAQLKQGQPAATIVGPRQIDAGTSLAPFVTIYDGGDEHTSLASSGHFEGHTLTLPAGVFKNAKAHGEERFTWRTIEGQREAVVLLYVDDPQPAYVLAARNLREVETREDELRLETLAALAGVALLGSAFVILAHPKFTTN